MKAMKSLATRLLSVILAAAMAVTLLPEAAKTVKFKAVSMGNSRCAAISETPSAEEPSDTQLPTLKYITVPDDITRAVDIDYIIPVRSDGIIAGGDSGV